MTTIPTISILIPVYNVEQYVEECLQSILQQIDENAEVIIMNDKSTDNSWEIVQKFANHSQITLVEAPHNRGLSATRNEMLKLAKLKYIWFIDSDDVMRAGAYQLAVNQLKQMPVDVLFCDYMAWRGDIKKQKSGFVGKPNQYYQNKNASFFKNLVKSNSNYAWNKIFKKSVIDNIQFQVGKKFEDIYYMADLAEFVQDFCYCQIPLIDYRLREGSITQVFDRKYIDDYLEAFIYREQTWEKLVKDFKQDEFSYYLWYKSFNRFVGLVNELYKNQQIDELNYVKKYYANIFFHYQQQSTQHLGFLRKLRMYYQQRNLTKYLNQGK